MNIESAYEVGCVAAMLPLFSQPTQSLSATAGETQIGLLGPGPVTVKLGTVFIHPQATLAASDSNYWLFQVYKRSSGGAGVLIAQGSTAATLNNPVNAGGGLTAWTPAALTVQTGAGGFISAQDVITIIVTKTGTPANIAYALGGFTTIN